MCGIIGYAGKSDAFPILLEGLKRLEYRGYDSFGFACCSGSGLKCMKSVGKISVFRPEKGLEGSLGIAHTRWSTHGEPSERNAHPHTDCYGDIAVVHNGIIENFSALRELLEKEGHSFRSKTDSEVLAHLIERFLKAANKGNGGDLEEAVRQALLLVEGTYGLAAVRKGDGKIVVARKGSPIVIGVKEGSTMVASDVSPLLEHTKDVVYLDDGEIGVLTSKGFSVRNLADESVEKDVERVTQELESIEKKGYKHFMLKEITEQPESISNTLRGRIGHGVKLSIEPGEVNRVIITACGTSWHSALIGKHYMESAGIPCEVDYASEFRYRDPLVGSGDLVVAISQSGETADTLEAMKEAKRKGARTLAIVNVVGSTIAREADTGIYLHAGPEIGVASTKAFTSQVAALLLLSLWFRQGTGKPLDAIEGLRGIAGDIRQALDSDSGIREIAKSLSGHRNALYLGRGLNFPVALEGALKLKEISYIHAEGYPAAEMKHGPIALIDENMPVIFILAKDHTYEKVLSNMQEVRARKGRIIAITPEPDDPKVREMAEHVIPVPRTSPELSPLVNVIPLQLLAYHIADIKGIDPDRPRNLAKSVTVE